jgi:hypothetical protein
VKAGFEIHDRDGTPLTDKWMDDDSTRESTRELAQGDR